jgi:GAF domain-containing protein
VLLEEASRIQVFVEHLPAILTAPDIARVTDAGYSFVPAQLINLLVASHDGAESKRLMCAASRQADLIGRSVPTDAGLIGYVAQSGRMIHLENPSSDWRFDEKTDSIAGIDMQTLMIVPIRAQSGGVVGLLQAVNSTRSFQVEDGDTEEGRSFTEDDENILQILAYCIGQIMEKSSLENQLRAQQKQTNALHQIVGLNSLTIGNQSKAPNQHASEAIVKIIRACYMICHCDHVTVYLVDHANNELVSTSKTSRAPRVKMTAAGIAGFVATSGQTVNCPDTAVDLRFNVAEDRKIGVHTFNILAVPIKDLEGKTVAVIKLSNRLSRSETADLPLLGATKLNKVNKKQEEEKMAPVKPKNLTPFSSSDQRMVESLAVTAAGALTQARLYEEAIKRRRETESLLRINELMQIEIATEKIIPKIIESAYHLIAAERISLFTVDNDQDHQSHTITQQLQGTNKELVCQVSADKNLEGKRFPWGAGIIGTVARTQKNY